MVIFNLTDKPLNYRGVVLAPNGGSYDFKDMSFIPNRDLELVSKKVLAVGHLPQWWLDERAVRAHHAQEAMRQAAAAKKTERTVDPVLAVDSEKKHEPRDFRKK